MNDRQISVSVDTFAQIWAARLPGENSEDQILARVLHQDHSIQKSAVPEAIADAAQQGLKDLPPNKKWTDLLIWTLRRHGGCASLSEIYQTSRRGRLALGFRVTRHHDDSARECLESHCRDSKKFKGTELFWMPEGKGAGVWALVGDRNS
jgi:hypothetical protein